MTSAELKEHAPASGLAEVPPCRPINLLAYVHLRNIYGSTGAGRVARQLTEHLAQQPGVDLKVLADSGDHARFVGKVGEPWTSFDYRFFKKETSSQQLRWLLASSPAAEYYWPEANVVYCTAESYVPVRKAALAVTLHDAAFFEADAHLRNLSFYRQQLKWRYLYRVISRKADLFHTVSQFSADRLSHFFPAIGGRIRVVHNAVTDLFFSPVSEAGRSYLAANGLDQTPFVLLPRGLAHRKNADLVLDNWPILRSMHPGLKLVITSHCDPNYVDRAQSLPDVVLTGFVSDDALCALYSAARVVWFPSLYEGFGLPVVEGMACGAPVVAADSSSLPEITGGAALLVGAKKPQEHVEALDAVLNDAALREDLSRRGREWANCFRWQTSAAKLRGYLSELV